MEHQFCEIKCEITVVPSCDFLHPKRKEKLPKDIWVWPINKESIKGRKERREKGKREKKKL